MVEKIESAYSKAAWQSIGTAEVLPLVWSLGKMWRHRFEYRKYIRKYSQGQTSKGLGNAKLDRRSSLKWGAIPTKTCWFHGELTS